MMTTENSCVSSGQKPHPSKPTTLGCESRWRMSTSRWAQRPATRVHESLGESFTPTEARATVLVDSSSASGDAVAQPVPVEVGGRVALAALGHSHVLVPDDVLH